MKQNLWTYRSYLNTGEWWLGVVAGIGATRILTLIFNQLLQKNKKQLNWDRLFILGLKTSKYIN